MANNLFIDVDNISNARRIYRALARLKSTHSIDKPVNYYFGTVQRECIITLCTDMSEDQLDNWLYARKAGNGYIGCGVTSHNQG